MFSNARTKILMPFIVILLLADVVHAAEPVEYSVGLPLSDFQTLFDRKLSERTVPQQVSSYPTRTEEHYTVIWNSKPRVDSELQAGLGPDELTKAIEIREAKNLHPAQLVPYSLGADQRFLVLFEGSQPNVPRIRHGLLRSEVDKFTQEQQKDDYYPMQVTGYLTQGKERFAGIWNHSDIQQTEAEVGLSRVVFEKRIKEQNERGVMIKRFNVYMLRARETYTVVWEQKKGVAQEFRSLMAEAVLASTNEEMAKDGFQLMQIWGYEARGRDRFAALWESATAP